MSGHPDQFFGGKTYSQHGEDLLVCNLFWLMGVSKPSYLDIGAHHPWNISNTALLYKRGSRGVNVEANPNLLDDFRSARPEDKNLCLGIGVTEGTLPFYMFDEKSGRNTFSKPEADQFTRDYPQFYVREIKQIPVVQVSTLIREHCGGSWPDFLSLDAEGMDYDILYTADFRRTRPKVVCVEVRKQHSLDFASLMARRGFLIHCRMGENLIFIDSKYEEAVK